MAGMASRPMNRDARLRLEHISRRRGWFCVSRLWHQDHRRCLYRRWLGNRRWRQDRLRSRRARRGDGRYWQRRNNCRRRRRRLREQRGKQAVGRHHRQHQTGSDNCDQQWKQGGSRYLLHKFISRRSDIVALTTPFATCGYWTTTEIGPFIRTAVPSMK